LEVLSEGGVQVKLPSIFIQGECLGGLDYIASLDN